MQRALLNLLAAAAAAASLAAFPIASAGQTDQKPTLAEEVQHWAEVGIENQLKGLTTSLRLTADQEKNWDPFASAVKDAQMARVLALQKEQSGTLSPMALNVAKAERLQESQANLQKIVDAATPLYTSLDKTQKHKFITQGRMLVPERGQFAKAMRRVGLSKGD